MPPELGGIYGRLIKDLPLDYLQGGEQLRSPARTGAPTLLGRNVLWDEVGMGGKGVRCRQAGALCLQKYLAHKKQPPPRILQWDYTQGHMVVPWGGCFL